MRLRLSVLLALILIGGACLPTRSETTSHFFFVQITDTHWGTRNGLASTRKAVEAINELPIKLAFVAHTGDITADTIGDSNVVNEGLAVMKKLSAPVYYVPGNHDILKSDARRTAKLYRQSFGALSTRVEVEGVVCLFFYSEPMSSDLRIGGYDARSWLNENLEAAGRKPVLLFQHIPAVHDVHGPGGETAWTDSYSPAWLRLFEKNPQIKAVVAGHFHRDELHWVGGTPVYVSSSVADFWGRQPSFRVYEYNDGRLGYWTVYL